MRIDSEDINLLNIKENNNESRSEYNEILLSEQVNKNLDDIEQLMIELQRSETELRKRILKEENNKTIDINAIDDVIITLPPTPDTYFKNKERRIQNYKSYNNIFHIEIYSNFIKSLFGIIYWIFVYLFNIND